MTVSVPEPLTPPAVRFELPGYRLAAALELESVLGISHVLAQVLVRRGHDTPQLADAFLAANEEHDPGLFEGIADVTALIRSHIERHSRIVVHGDYDADGVCATAVLVRALRTLAADVSWYLPSRIDDGYGLAAETVERLAARGTGLLITVDCGITAVEEVAAARAAGIDVIITDHHAPRADGALPQAPIVHPVVCGYPFAGLCGTAVAHKLAQALGAQTVTEDLELVALATVADLMPLLGENRRLVRAGLAQMAGTRRPGLRALMASTRTDPSALDATAIAFRLAPRINAAGRMRRADAALELLLTDSAERAEEVAAELNTLNVERRAVEERIRWEAVAQAAEQGERFAYVLAGAGWHPGVIGIVASRMVEQLERPVVMVALSADGSVGQGSGRSVPGFDLLAALDACGEHLERHGGHRAAAGLSLKAESLDDFRDAFELHAQLMLSDESVISQELADAVVSGPELTLALAQELQRVEPTGNSNPPVALLVPGATFDDVRAMGDGKHARFTVNSGGVRAAAVAFACAGKPEGADAGPVDATFTLERRIWNGVEEPRLLLRRAAVCAPAEIMALGEPGDYLSAVIEELYRDLEPDPALEEELGAAQQRIVLDRRGQSSIAVIRDAEAAAAGSGVLVICADLARRLPGLASRCGGFALISHAALAEEPELMWQCDQVVVIDPPASPSQAALARAGEGVTHIAYGAAELRFAQQVHEREYALRSSLVELYRTLRERGSASGEELEQLLRGDGSRGRSARLAGRLIRVLTELELISLDLDLPAITLTSAQKTDLERSVSYVAYSQIYEEGQRFLSR